MCFKILSYAFCQCVDVKHDACAEYCCRDAVSGVTVLYLYIFFFQAEDGIRYLVRSRGLGDVYKRQASECSQVSGRLVDQTNLRAEGGVQALRAGHDQFLSLIHI